MRQLFFLRYCPAVVLLSWATVAAAQDSVKSYPITFDADDVHAIPSLSLELNSLKVTGKDVIAIPIRCEAGITGAMVFGDGEYRMSANVAGGEISGKFRAAMLRFHPADQSALLPIDRQTAFTDRAVHEMGRHMLDNVFRHCWHRGMEALLPEQGSLAANVYSTTEGDLLISTTPNSRVVHNFTAKATLLDGTTKPGAATGESPTMTLGDVEISSIPSLGGFSNLRKARQKSDRPVDARRSSASEGSRSHDEDPMPADKVDEPCLE